MMKKFLSNTAIFLLLINSASAFFKGWGIIADPYGNEITSSRKWLRFPFFDNYPIPEIILCYANGLFSLIVILSILKAARKYPLYILVMGCLITFWTVFEMSITRSDGPLQAIFSIVGMLLITVGALLSASSKNRVLRNHYSR